MTLRARGEQRRAHSRFELRGASTAGVRSMQQLDVLNVGLAGALVEASMPLPVNAEYQMQLVLRGDVTEANVKVRRVVALSGRDPARYHIGLEFLSIAPDGLQLLQQLLADAEGDEPHV